MRGLIAGFLLAVLALAGCATEQEQWIDRGVYEVVSIVEDPGDLRPANPGERWFPYVPAARDDGPARHVLLRRDGAVLLELSSDPVLNENAEGRKQIALTLTPEAGNALAGLTRRVSGGKVAIVVKGDVVSYHTVRQPILGNCVAISC